MCNTFTTNLLQIVGIYLFPSDLESLSNNIFVEIIISSLLWYMYQFYDQYLNWKLMKYVYLFFTIIIWFIGDVSYTFYFIPCYVDGLFWNFFLPFSFEYTHIYNYESVCCHYLKLLVICLSFEASNQMSKKEFYNNISNTMDMRSDIKVQNQLLLNSFTSIFYM